MRSLNEGSQETYTFELKIDKRVAGAKGSVALSSEARPFDPDKTNDKAAITLDVTSGGPSDSTGGSTGSTTGGADTSGGGSSSTGGGTASGGNGSTTGGSGTTTGGSATTTGGNLADTGSSTLPLAGAAAAAVTLGAGTFLIVRRRRTQNMN
ncbi:MAG: LPXTG cell wall anchor domain-containing protein [Nonomuraea sp.]|nr:LPXTG cell wall anchor domain-containing protein [Nonomuraea sp.]